MTVGRTITRRAYVTVNQPTGGAAASAITIGGTIAPNGMAVEYAWGSGSHTPPETGWTAATASDGAGNWSSSTTRPAAGTRFLWARSALYPRSAKPSGPVVITA